MKKDILKYIKNEKDIAKYHINLIENSKNISISKRRILEIEKEFLSLPLENMDFIDIADVAAAISIYRTSRNSFYNIYKMNPPDKKDIIEQYNQKFNYLKNLANYYMHVRPQEINLVQNFDLYLELLQKESKKNKNSLDLERKKFDKFNIQQLQKIEPIVISKKRARIQIVFFSIGKYIDEELKKISLFEKNEIKLDEIIFSIKENMFLYYNDAIKILPEILENTMGYNQSISKIHFLENILNFENPKIEKINLKNKFNKSFNKKNYGIIFPIPRIGNEKMSLLYKKIYLGDIDVTKLFCNYISNVKVIENNKSIYFKSILLEPFMHLADLNAQNFNLFLKNYFNLNVDNVNLNNIEIINKINSFNKSINISTNSVILTAKTRSEEEGIVEINKFIEIELDQINKDYLKITYPTNDSK